MTTYITKTGDMFDSISREVYGSEAYMSKIIMANPKYSGVYFFKAGVELKIPKISHGGCRRVLRAAVEEVTWPPEL